MADNRAVKTERVPFLTRFFRKRAEDLSLPARQEIWPVAPPSGEEDGTGDPCGGLPHL